MVPLCTCPNVSTSFLCRRPRAGPLGQQSGWCPQEWSRGSCWSQGRSLDAHLCAMGLWPCQTPLRSLVRSSVEPMQRQISSAAWQRFLCSPSWGQLPRHSTWVPAPEQLQDVLLLLDVTPPQWLLLSAEVQCSRGMTSLERNPSYVPQMRSGCVLCRVLFNRH